MDTVESSGRSALAASKRLASRLPSPSFVEAWELYFGFRVASQCTMGPVMRVRRSIWIVLAVVMLLGAIVTSAGFAGGNAGDAAHFLRDGLGARGRAIGSAQIALADGFAAPYWNPAPCVQSTSTVVGSGLEQRHGGLFTFGVLGGWHATESWAAGAVVLTSELYDVYHVSGGFRLGDAAAGLGVRSYQFGVPGDRGSGLGLDIGARYVIELSTSCVTIAAVSRDIGWTSIRWGALEIEAVDRVAWVSRIGVAMSVPLTQGEWTIEIDGELATRRPPEDMEADFWSAAGDLNVSIGTALQWIGIRISAGIQRYDLRRPNARPRPTIGLGIRVGDLSIDLALVPSSLGSTYLGGFEIEL